MNNKRWIPLFSIACLLLLYLPNLAKAEDITFSQYENSSLHYSFVMPDTFQPVSDSVLQTIAQQDASVVGVFHLATDAKNSLLPSIYLSHYSVNDSYYAYLSDVFDQFGKNADTAKQTEKDQILSFAKEHNQTVNVKAIEFYADKNLLIVEKELVNDSGSQIQFIAQFIGPNGVEYIDCYSDGKDADLNVKTFQYLVDSFQYVTKFKYVTLSQSIDDKMLKPVKPLSEFSPDASRMYLFVALDSPLTQDITCNWYFVKDGKKTLKHTTTNTKHGGDVYWFWYPNYGVPFDKGQWEVELKTGESVETIPFMVTDNKSKEKPINVYINGIQKNFTQPPVMLQGSTIVPLRGIFELLGASIQWDNKTQTVKATKDNMAMSLTINKDTAFVNGKEIKLAQKASVINHSTMVPLRFVSEALGANVKWDGNTNSIFIDQQ